MCFVFLFSADRPDLRIENIPKLHSRGNVYTYHKEDQF